MFTYTKSRALAVAILLAAVSAFGQVSPTISTATSSPQLPPIGIAPSETVQVNVVNNAQPPATGGAAPLCSGTIVFYGASGQTILGPIAPFQVSTGQIFSVSLPYATTGASGA